jgi:ubiquinone/menaquinone biosynthesis C-methylase UbiE
MCINSFLNNKMVTEAEANDTTTEAERFYDAHAARPQPTLDVRQKSPSILVREANNRWKRKLLLRAAHLCRLRLLPFSKRHAKAANVELACADLACGKGGDLPKWRLVNPDSLLMVDISLQSLQEARRRAIGIGMRAQMLRCDLTQHPIPSADTSLDLVSMQFALHYIVLGGEDALDWFLSEVGRVLKRGGVFIATIPNEDVIAPMLEMGGWACDIASIQPTQNRNTYRFTLKDAVENVEEAVVDINKLETCARTHGLVRERDFEVRPALAHADAQDIPRPLDQLYRAIAFIKQ